MAGAWLGARVGSSSGDRVDASSVGVGWGTVVGSSVGVGKGAVGAAVVTALVGPAVPIPLTEPAVAAGVGCSLFPAPPAPKNVRTPASR